ncbi:MAG: response regulator [Flavobacteriales bacterium]
MHHKKTRILIVEDDPIIAEDILDALEDKGYVVSAIAHSYEQGLEELQRRTIDLAVLDINLEAEKSGIDVAKFIQTHKDMPYIFLTSYSDEKTLEMAQATRPYGYLVKPFQDATLISTVSLALSNYANLKTKPEPKVERFELTQREADICRKMCTGLSYDEIANSEFISVNTVRYHIKNIYVKLDVNSRAALLQKLLA